MRILVCLVFTLLSIVAVAQEASVAAGGDGSGAGGTVAFSIGQTVYQHIENPSGAVGEGVQQPFEMFTLSDFAKLYGIVIDVYPNPATNELRIESTTITEQMHWQLFDAQGRLIAEDVINGNSALVDLSNLSSALYILSIAIDHHQVRTCQIIKH